MRWLRRLWCRIAGHQPATFKVEWKSYTMNGPRWHRRLKRSKQSRWKTRCERCDRALPNPDWTRPAYHFGDAASAQKRTAS